jgi:hypothetical protein
MMKVAVRGDIRRSRRLQKTGTDLEPRVQLKQTAFGPEKEGKTAIKSAMGQCHPCDIGRMALFAISRVSNGSGHLSVPEELVKIA